MARQSGTEERRASRERERSYLVAREDDVDVAPAWIGVNLVVNVELDVLGELVHEAGAYLANQPSDNTHTRRGREGFAASHEPGVMQLESNIGPAGGALPREAACSSASCVSRALRKRRARCWFILARGATPTHARTCTALALSHTRTRERERDGARRDVIPSMAM